MHHLFRRNLLLSEGQLLVSAALFTDTLTHAAILCDAAIILILIPGLLTAMLPLRSRLLRTLVYSAAAALVYVPLMLGLDRFSSDAALRGFCAAFLLMIPGICSAFQGDLLRGTGGFLHTLKSMLAAAFGAGWVMLLLGAVRELLGFGALYGHRVLTSAPLPFLATVQGGMLCTVLLGAMLIQHPADEEADAS